MNDTSTTEPAAPFRLREHPRLILLVVVGLATSVLAVAGVRYGLTMYVLFLSVLLASTWGRALKATPGMSVFGAGLESGASAVLLFGVAATSAWGCVLWHYSDWEASRFMSFSLGASIFALWAAWSYAAFRGADSKRQSALAAGMSCGILGICLWAALLIRGSDWPMAMVSPTVLALTPFTFFVPWWLWKNVLRAWNRIQSCKANTDSLQQERDEELSCKGSDSNTSVPSACEEREADAPLQFSLRSVFLLIVAMAILFGGLRTKIAQIQRQRLAVERLGGPSAVELWNADFFHRHSTPAWLKPILGEEYSADAHIHLQRDAIADEDLSYLQYFLNDVNLTLEGGFGGDSLRFVGRARNIRWMCLDDNPVTDNGLQHLKGLRSLESLSLASTEVTDAGLQYLSSLDGLWKLDLSGNQGVTDAGIVWLPGKRLGDLNFDDTGITDAALGRLRRLPSHLACANTEITDLGLKYLEDAPMLMTLNLNGTRVTDEGLAYLRGCQRLIRLHLNGTRVTDAGLVHLAHLNRLNGLSLGNTRITDDGLAHLADLKRLGELDLSNTDITDDGLKYLEYLQGLDELDLRGTKVTQQGIQQFKSPSWCTVQGP